MPRRNVRVDIPHRDHLQMIELVDAIAARHTELAGDSPLNDPIIDLVALAASHNTHRDEYNEATELHGKGEAATEAADIALGTNEGQTIETEGTIYYHVGRIRSRLAIAHEDNEEEITTFGFNVVVEVVRGRKVVRIDIPIAEHLRMTKLVNDIFKRHTELGGSSPLDTPTIDLVELDALHTTHQDKRAEADEFHGKGEAAMQRANKALGIGKGQTVKTKDTVYNLTARIRDHLSIAHQGFEEELSTFGYNVVITMTPLPGEPGPTVITGNVPAGETVNILDSVDDASTFSLQNTGSVPLTFCRMESETATCDPLAHITVDPGLSTEVTGTELGATGTWLNVSNTDETTSGSFRVEVSV